MVQALGLDCVDTVGEYGAMALLTRATGGHNRHLVASVLAAAKGLRWLPTDHVSRLFFLEICVHVPGVVLGTRASLFSFTGPTHCWASSWASGTTSTRRERGGEVLLTSCGDPAPGAVGPDSSIACNQKFFHHICLFHHALVCFVRNH